MSQITKRPQVKDKKHFRHTALSCSWLLSPTGLCAMIAFTCVLSVLTLVTGQQELLKNRDMEMVVFTHNWYCSGCTLTTSKDHLTGYHSALVTNRHRDFDGLAQDVTVVGGHRYNFTAFIKLLNLENGALYQTVELIMSCPHNGRKTYTKFGHNPYVRQGQWTLVGGIAVVPQGSHTCKTYVQVRGSHVTYHVDAASLKMVPDDTNWKSEAQARIEKIRKADITISLRGAQPSDTFEIELIQKTHKFGFGSAVGASQIVDPNYKKYQDVFYDTFEWAVLENALKWKIMERVRGHINYDKPLTALRALQARGTKVRGHCVFWSANTIHIPPWVTSLSKPDVLSAIQTRINGVVGATKGLVEHWDVNNEHIHGDWFAQKTGNPNITMEMFKDIHNVDPNVKLFLNDFGVLQSSFTAEAYYNEAKLLRDSNVPVYGVGIQSHLKGHNIDMTALKGRLDVVAAVGLPIWITELSIAEPNANLKAATLTDVMTMYFSHPGVEGVLLWGFWDGKLFTPDAKLFEGPNVTPNAAGSALLNLLKHTWKTDERHPIHGGEDLTVRGFKGQYQVNVKRGSYLVHSETFDLDDGGKTLQIQIACTVYQALNYFKK